LALREGVYHAGGPKINGTRSRSHSSAANDPHPASPSSAPVRHLTTAPDPTRGKTLLTDVIDALRGAVTAGLEELATLGRTLHRRRDDVLAYFMRPEITNW
jgi:hypothetical protein